MNDIVISLKNVSKYYKLYDNPKYRLKEALHPKGKTYHKKFYATKNINIEIKKGEILGIVGKNGSGKSTLLKLITGVLQPDEGTVTVNGKISALLELGSGFNPEFTGMQNIFFYGTILGFSKEEMNEKLDDILAFADIGDFIDQPLKTYSSGMKSRLGFAVAVHIDPEILILDEVLSVGDVLFKRKCYAKMEEVFKGGKTIIYVSHDANSINELCTRAIFLNGGNILLDSNPKTVTTIYQKYLFSNDQNIENLKNDIHSIQKHKNKAIKPKHDLKIKDNISPDNTQNKEMADFLKGLTITPTLINDNIAHFSNVHIKDNLGNIVNNLLLKQRYTIGFNITFLETLYNVSIGFQIKTIKGILLSGFNMKNSINSFIQQINSQDIYTINAEFDCMILPGDYIIKIFILSNNQDICEMEDALLFKVKANKYVQGGYMTLNQTINYKLKK